RGGHEYGGDEFRRGGHRGSGAARAGTGPHAPGPPLRLTPPPPRELGFAGIAPEGAVSVAPRPPADAWPVSGQGWARGVGAVTVPRERRVPWGPGAVAVRVTSSPSARKPRVVPSGRTSGRAPFEVSSMRQPRVPGAAPLTVPDAKRSPGRTLAPFTVRCA